MLDYNEIQETYTVDIIKIPATYYTTHYCILFHCTQSSFYSIPRSVLNECLDKTASL